MKLKTLILLLFVSNFLYSQNIFTTDIFKEDTSIVIYTGAEAKNKEIIFGGFCGKRDSIGWVSIGQYLVKLDSAGNILKDYKETIQDTVTLINGVFLSDTCILTTCYSGPLDGSYGNAKILIKTFDYNLNLLSSRVAYTFPDSIKIDATVIKSKMNGNNDLYIYTDRAYSENSRYDCVLKINNDTSVLKLYHYFHTSLHFLNNDKACLITYDNHSCDAHGSLFILDDNLTITDTVCFDENDSIEEGDDYLLPIGENRYFYNGSGISGILGGIKILRILDSNFNVLREVVLDSIGYEWSDNYTNGACYLYPEHIYLANYVNGAVYSLISTDTTLNIRFHKFISSNNYFAITSAIPTLDTGYIMIIIVGGENTSTRIIKFDKYGNYETTTISETIKISDFSVYPNPASDILRIQKSEQVEQADFVLYNTVGQVIMQKNITEKNTEIDISSLPEGIYIYNFLEQNKIVDRGKIIVE